jgi:hypothetical protein
MKIFHFWYWIVNYIQYAHISPTEIKQYAKDETDEKVTITKK